MRRRRGSRGQSLAEFALAFPLFLFVFIGIAEGGYFVVASTIVSNATHEGARVGVLADTSKNALVNKVIDSAKAVTAISSSDVQVCVNGSNCTNDDFSGRAAGDTLNVKTAYAHRPLVGYVLPALSFSANAEAELWVEEDISP